jgi:hypothetical protein
MRPNSINATFGVTTLVVLHFGTDNTIARGDDRTQLGRTVGAHKGLQHSEDQKSTATSNRYRNLKRPGTRRLALRSMPHTPNATGMPPSVAPRQAYIRQRYYGHILFYEG